MEMRKVVLDENVIPPMTHPWGESMETAGQKQSGA